MEGSACGGEASRHCVQRSLGRGAARLPCSHSLYSLWGFGLLGLICAVLCALLFLYPVFCGMKCLAFCALPLFCPVTTQVSSVFVGRVEGERKKAKKSTFNMRPVMQGTQGKAEWEGAAEPVNPSM